MQHNTKKYLIPVVIILVSGLFFFLLKATQPDKSVVESRENIAQVNVETLRLVEAAPQLSAVAQVVSQDITPLMAPAQLFVEKIKAKVGDYVEQGSVLLTLDNRELLLRQAQLQADVNAFEAELESAALSHQYNQQALKNEQALLAIARRNVSRNEQLAGSQSGSQAALDSARQALQQQSLAIQQRKQAIDAYEITKKRLEAQLAKAQANLDLTNLDIARSKVRAPFSGYVTALHVAKGQQVMANGRLVEMYRQGSLELKVQLPMRYSDVVSRALNAGKEITALADNGEQYYLDRIAASVGQNQAGVDSYFTLPKDTLARLGQTLSISINLPPFDNVMTAPLDALYDDNQIFLVQDNILQGMRVKRLGQYQDEAGRLRVIIQQGELQEGLPILVSRLPQAISGQKVAVSNNNIVSDE